MKCILREKLLTRAFKLAEVNNVYRVESHRFVEAYFSWLEETERDLSGLRSPISIMLQAEKNSLISVINGSVNYSKQGAASSRKYQRAFATESIERVAKEIYSKIEEIDLDFNQLREKLCNTVAVLACKEPDLYEKIQLNEQGVKIIWKKLGSTAETIPMYNYFCAKLSSTDINYLLMDIIEKILSNK